jgi:hypothetical protein
VCGDLGAWHINLGAYLAGWVGVRIIGQQIRKTLKSAADFKHQIFLGNVEVKSMYKEKVTTYHLENYSDD